MKKLVAMVLALVMMLSFVPQGIMATANAVDNDEFNVSVFWYDFADAYLAQVRDSLDNELDACGFDFISYDACLSQATQNDQIDTAIEQGTDLLIVNIVDTASLEAQQAVVNKAKAAGLPIIFFNREVSDSIINSYKNACFVGARAAEAGDKQGIMAGNYIVENYDAVDLNGDGEISYIMMKGQLGNPEAEARTSESVRFANAILKEAGKPALKYYDPNNENLFQASNWSKNTAFELMDTALTTNPMDSNNPVEVVFANCDDMALGCIEALNNAGWNTGKEDAPSIPVFGIDCTNDAVYAIEHGRMTGTINHPVDSMAEAITALAQNAANGKNVFDGAEDMFYVDEGCAKIRAAYEIVTAENVDSPDYPHFPGVPSDPEYPSYPDIPNYPYFPDFGEGKVAVFWYNFNDAFLSLIRTALDNELDAAGLDYVNYDARNTQEFQLEQIDTAIEQGADLLIVNIVDTWTTESAQAIVDKAKAADIPVIFFNREVDDSVINSYENACYVGINATDAGIKQGIMAGEYIVDNYDAVDLNNDGEISYIMMKGEIGNPEAEARTYYSVEYTNWLLEEAGKPALKYYDPNNEECFHPSNWNKNTAFELMETALSTNPMNGNAPVEVVFANNDDAALGCIEALNNTGWNTGFEEAPSIPVFGIDFTYVAEVAINSGKMTGSVMAPVETIAYSIMTLAYNAVNDKNVFDGAEDIFKVDENCAKIRVPYEIKTEGSYYPDYPDYPIDFPSMITGDANGDYTVSNADLILTARYIVELVDELPRVENADINGDGIITNSDLVEIAIILVSDPEPVDVVAGVFWYDFSDAFLSTVRTALDDMLAEAGINFTNYDAQCTQAIQNDQIDHAIAHGANLLIVNVVDTAAVDAAQAIANKAKSVGVPVIFFNREVDDSVINSYANACFVGTRAAEAGKLQGQMAGEYIVENYNAVDLNKDGKISYIMMKGELGNPEAEARTYYSVKCANEILEEAGKPALVYYDNANTNKFQPSNWSKNTAFELMDTALSTNPMNGNNPIEVVFANNDDAALGCIEALNNAGWNRGSGKSIPVFGIDYTADAADAIWSGKMTGSILQSATGMAETITVLASNVEDGEHVFANAVNEFVVDSNVNKIRVPYEIMM